MNEGAFRKRTIPTTLHGKSRKEIEEWARKQLSGQEAQLSRSEIKDIQNGTIEEIVLKPRKKGFFLPTGEFIEAYDYSPSIGEDFSEAEQEWQHEDIINQWISEENELFHKSDKQQALDYWGHGKRISDTAEIEALDPLTICRRLYEQGGSDSYSYQVHQYCYYFYKWTTTINPDHPVFSWNWHRIAILCRFIADYPDRRVIMKRLMFETDLSSLDTEFLYVFLGNKKPPESIHISDDDIELIHGIRRKLKNGIMINDKELSKLIKINSLFC